MNSFVVCDGKSSTDFFVEDSAFEGVKEIAKTVAEDIKLVTDVLPGQVSDLGKISPETVVIAATLGRSPLIDALSDNGIIDVSDISGKREVFLMQILDLEQLKNNADTKDSAQNTYSVSFGSAKKALIILGSDKRGTIYGLFKLSELCGVSPLVYFGDAYPVKKNTLEITLGNASDRFVSKEPSVYYRGFFINDEWPAFGNWATEQFGGVNAKCYKKVFELLLRLKGNYFWPAMWNSSFSEEGPGIENARLADMYGVVMGTSHHEPLCRAGNEWQNQFKKYGDDNSWSFITNDKAITKFWEDGVIRNKEFENVYTIGMRGEADSKLLPEDATMKDNIEVVKKAILAQDEILKKYISDDLTKVPRMLAIYKEVEDYYYGDETCEGLKDWDELKDTIFLLSDDNHGNLRNLPTEAERKHPGGFGMYYHFDYHGAPISYEWTNCNRLTKTWEQMSQAYEAGVTKMWIVNVGDLKEMEYPLSFFMELAYDFENWGGKNGLNRVKKFAYKWIDTQFADKVSAQQKDMIFKVLQGYTKWNAIRTPETMNDTIYNPVHFREGERVLAEVRDVLDTAEKLKKELSGDALLTYQSVIYYAAAASLNMVIAWILTGFNHMLAAKGAVFGGYLTDEIEARIEYDQRLIDEFNKIADGKWNHCLSSAHTGFRSWDDREWFYPVTCKVTPTTAAKALVSFRGSDRYHLGAYWQDMAPIVNCDFMKKDTDLVLLDIDARGKVPFDYEVTFEDDLLSCENAKGRVELMNELPCAFTGGLCGKDYFGKDSLSHYGRRTVAIALNEKSSKKSGEFEVRGRVNISFDNGQKTYVDLVVKGIAGVSETGDDSAEICKDVPFVCFKADKFVENKKEGGNGFEVVDFLGREGSAIKAFPSMASYEDSKEAPSVTYKVNVSEDGEYDVIFYLLTRNPSYKGGRMKFSASVNDKDAQTIYSVSDHYYTEWQDTDWAQGVLTGARQVEASFELNKGENELHIFAGDPGVILEKIVVKKKNYTLPVSYLGPEE
ncbi:glycosyl hydrolase 115 family protein [Butyrivibrio sp. YAB3001]|uniref:glycosyl hydrolase 115 family protein n=1 Tax=Butyrivibrio sp. YAB3001 TaxID=1520812 RepID=UPI0008F68054|nr:glycosyl hydrolase 115 family protein [Butyrivibrio sp. YAB3001]SFB72897.1 Glycosyl hydrolase family 115 [Butyrivibrio sp. YAB3001]